MASDNNNWMEVIILVTQSCNYLFAVQTTICCLLAISMFTDSLLAFKVGLVSSFGIFIVFALTMLYKDGRPFWDYEDVSPYSNCLYSFASPESRQFILTFVWPYLFIQSRLKYVTQGERSRLLTCVCFTFVIAFMILNYFNGVFNGINYLYQTLFGNLYGFCYLVMCLVFDAELHRYCEKTGFILKSSRGRKFWLMFFCLGMILVELVYFLSEVGNWNMPQDWIYNA